MQKLFLALLLLPACLFGASIPFSAANPNQLGVNPSTGQLWLTNNAQLTNVTVIGAEVIKGSSAGTPLTINTNQMVLVGGILGIGTATPDSGADMEIFNDSASGILRLTRDAGSQRGLLEFGRHNGGTFQPTARLASSSTAGGNSNSTFAILTPDGSGNMITRIGVTTAGGAYTASTFASGNGGTTPISYNDLYGNVTIGSTYVGVRAAPTDGLLVEGALAVQGNISGTNGMLIKGSSAQTNALFVGPGGTISSNASGSVTMNGGVETISTSIAAFTPLTIQNSSVSGYSALNIQDNSGNANAAFGYGNASVGTSTLQGRAYFYTAPAIDFVVLNNTTINAIFKAAGNVGIGTANPFTTLTVNGTTTSSNGVASYASNLLAVATITVGASPFNWTNTTGGNVYVFVDGVSVTGTTAINGGVVFNTIGQNTIPLQKNEYTTITYTIGTPTAKWKPF